MKKIINGVTEKTYKPGEDPDIEKTVKVTLLRDEDKQPFYHAICTEDNYNPSKSFTGLPSDVDTFLDAFYYQFDEAGNRVLDMTIACGEVCKTTRRFYPNGKLKEETNKNTITYYNEDGQPTKVTRPNGEVLSEVEYDTHGNMIKSWNINGFNGVYRYHENGVRSFEQESDINKFDTYKYDEDGNVIMFMHEELELGKSFRKDYIRNAKGQLIQEKTTDMDTKEETSEYYTYDSSGNQVSMYTDYNDDYSFSVHECVFNKPIYHEHIVHGGPHEAGEALVCITEYDDKGNITKTITYDPSELDEQTTTTYEYDERGNNTKYTKDDHDINYVVLMDYDENDNLVSYIEYENMRIVFSWVKEYDDEGKLTLYRDSKGNTEVATYDNKGKLRYHELLDGSRKYTFYDEKDRLVYLREEDSNKTIITEYRAIFGKVESVEFLQKYTNGELAYEKSIKTTVEDV